MNRHGWTMIEVLCVLALAVPVTAVVQGLLSRGVVALACAEERLEQREKVFAALNVLHTELLDAVAYQVAPDGLELKYLGPHGATTVSLDARTGRLTLKREADRSSRALVASGVQVFSVREIGRGHLLALLGVSRRFLSTAPRKKVDISCPCPCP